jgi:hypothetical protein
MISHALLFSEAFKRVPVHPLGFNQTGSNRLFEASNFALIFLAFLYILSM